MGEEHKQKLRFTGMRIFLVLLALSLSWSNSTTAEKRGKGRKREGCKGKKGCKRASYTFNGANFNNQIHNQFGTGGPIMQTGFGHQIGHTGISTGHVGGGSVGGSIVFPPPAPIYPPPPPPVPLPIYPPPPVLPTYPIAGTGCTCPPGWQPAQSQGCGGGNVGWISGGGYKRSGKTKRSGGGSNKKTRKLKSRSGGKSPRRIKAHKK